MRSRVRTQESVNCGWIRYWGDVSDSSLLSCLLQQRRVCAYPYTLTDLADNVSCVDCFQSYHKGSVKYSRPSLWHTTQLLNASNPPLSRAKRAALLSAEWYYMYVLSYHFQDQLMVRTVTNTRTCTFYMWLLLGVF